MCQPGVEKEGVSPARLELAALGYLLKKQSQRVDYETHVITNYTKETEQLD